MLSTVFSEPRQIALVCPIGRRTLRSLYIAEILRDCSIDCLAFCCLWFRIWLDISGKDSHLDVPGVQRLAWRGANGLAF